MPTPAVAGAAKALGRQALMRAAMSRRNRKSGAIGCGCVALVVLAAAVAAIGVLAAFVASVDPLAALQADTLPPTISDASLAPITCNGMQISQGYGDTPVEHPHTGIDLVCPAGTPVVAIAGGVLHHRSGGEAPCIFPAGARGGLGMYGEVDAGEVQYLYGHLEGFAFADNGTVAPGTVIGFEGSSGCSTGFHLHFEVRVAGRVTNPCAFLPQGYPAVHDAAGVRCWGSAPP